jgi:2-oxoglutarate dehydrogenase complex dehydrogenase (E1) component-like enzyme
MLSAGDGRVSFVCFTSKHVFPAAEAPLKSLIEALEAMYCGSIGFECMDLGDPGLER